MPPAAPVGAIFCEKGERARPGGAAPPPACWLARLLSGDTDEDLRQQTRVNSQCLDWSKIFSIEQRFVFKIRNKRLRNSVFGPPGSGGQEVRISLRILLSSSKNSKKKP